VIFYFSGVGNSLWVAKQIAKALDDNLHFIPDELLNPTQHILKNNEPLGFIFPCYGWGVPTFIEKFISMVDIQNVSYIYFVTTCGDDTGMTAENFCKDVEKRGWKCSLGYAVQMPESYICLPGFVLDSQVKKQRKYSKASLRINQIVRDISNCRTGHFDTIQGALKWAKSHIIRPFFNKVLITPRPFTSNSNCISCGKCAKECPMHNIKMLDNSKKSTNGKQPEWHHNCVLCLRCYHTCPTNAIQWTLFTKGKGQYLCNI
jgi:ferredoxin/flavodoxin